jgi:hypothetical protein
MAWLRSRLLGVLAGTLTLLVVLRRLRRSRAALTIGIPVAVSRRHARQGWPPEAFAPFVPLLTLAGSGLSGAGAAVLSLSFGSSHDRVPHSSDSRIDELWRAKLDGGSKLFDQSKFRLRRIGWEGRRIRLELGLTGYKEYIGTHRRPENELAALEAAGSAMHGEPRAHLSCALGCEAILLTADRQVVLLRRSAKTATHSGLYNGPSGHPEPQHAGIEAHTPSAQCAATEERVVSELFSSIVDEVHDETNLPRNTLSDVELIGAMEDGVRKPDLLFLLRTSHDAAGVRTCYERGAVEGWESDRLAFWPVDSLESCDLPLTPVTRAAFACFKIAELER